MFLAVAGLAKLLRPAGSGTALRAAGLPRPLTTHLAVRVFAAVEVGSGAVVLLVGGRAGAALFAMTFAVLAAVSVRMVARSPGHECGCFGGAASPASHWHTAVNLSCALSGAFAVWLDPPSFAAEVAGQAWLGIPFTGGVVLLAWLCFVTATALPALQQAGARLEMAR